jgi:hypothetical protein
MERDSNSDSHDGREHGNHDDEPGKATARLGGRSVRH